MRLLAFQRKSRKSTYTRISASVGTSWAGDIRARLAHGTMVGAMRANAPTPALAAMSAVRERRWTYGKATRIGMSALSAIATPRAGSAITVQMAATCAPDAIRIASLDSGRRLPTRSSPRIHTARIAATRPCAANDGTAVANPMSNQSRPNGNTTSADARSAVFSPVAVPRSCMVANVAVEWDYRYPPFGLFGEVGRRPSPGDTGWCARVLVPVAWSRRRAPDC